MRARWPWMLAVLAAMAAGACTVSPTGERTAPAPTGGPPATEAPSGTAAPTTTPSSTTTSSTTTTTPTTTTTADDPAGPPWLIKHGWDIPRPDFVAQNVAAMEQRGFDGVVIQIPSSGYVLSKQPVGYEQIRSELAPLGRTRFTTMRHNFVIVYSGDLGSYQDDWSTAVTNMGNLARAAREVGLQGIVYDNENYKGVVWDWKPGEAPTSLRRAEEIVLAKGRDVMSAIEGQWPTATVIAFYGPWLSDADTADYFEDVFEFNDVAWANELIGPFFLGMASALDDSDVRLVDGGEVYSLRSDADFEHAYEWMKGGVAAYHDLLPAQVRARYDEAVSVGFGVYDRSPRGTPVEPEEWKNKLTNALEVADHYVWAYTEAYDWWGKGWPEKPVPEEVIRATQAVQSSAGR